MYVHQVFVKNMNMNVIIAGIHMYLIMIILITIHPNLNQYAAIVDTGIGNLLIN